MLKLIDYTPIVLRAEADSNEYLEGGGAAKTFAAFTESHPGMFDGQQLTVPQDATLLVEGAVTVYGPEFSGIAISVNDNHKANDKRTCSSIVDVKKGDLLKIQWDVSGPTTALSGQSNTRLNITELVG